MRPHWRPLLSFLNFAVGKHYHVSVACHCKFLKIKISSNNIVAVYHRNFLKVKFRTNSMFGRSPNFLTDNQQMHHLIILFSESLPLKKVEHLTIVVITTAQLHSTKPELKFCLGSHPARGVSEIRDGADL